MSAHNLPVDNITELRPLLTTEDLAEYLQVPVSSIYDWRQKRTGPPCYRVGKYLRYRVSDVEAWLAEQAA